VCNGGLAEEAIASRKGESSRCKRAKDHAVFANSYDLNKEMSRNANAEIDYSNGLSNILMTAIDHDVIDKFCGSASGNRTIDAAESAFNRGMSENSKVDTAQKEFDNSSGCHASHAVNHVLAEAAIACNSGQCFTRSRANAQNMLANCRGVASPISGLFSLACV